MIKDEVSAIRSSGIHVLSNKIDIANARLEFARLRPPDRQPGPSGQGAQAADLSPRFTTPSIISPGGQAFPSGRQSDIKTLKIQKEEPSEGAGISCAASWKAESKVTGEEGLRALRLAISAQSQA
jgi:hypothetical protein